MKMKWKSFEQNISILYVRNGRHQMTNKETVYFWVTKKQIQKLHQPSLSHCNINSPVDCFVSWTLLCEQRKSEQRHLMTLCDLSI